MRSSNITKCKNMKINSFIILTMETNYNKIRLINQSFIMKGASKWNLDLLMMKKRKEKDLLS
ncbi:hypothetical protein EMIT040CA3_310146 [Bacillus pseudomycoides]